MNALDSPVSQLQTNSLGFCKSVIFKHSNGMKRRNKTFYYYYLLFFKKNYFWDVQMIWKNQLTFGQSQIKKEQIQFQFLMKAEKLECV